MSKLTIENLNLLNKMHEGLIVVSKKDRTLKFASRPAIHYLNTRTSPTDLSHRSDPNLIKRSDSKIQIDRNFLVKPLFDPTEVSVSSNENPLADQ